MYEAIVLDLGGVVVDFDSRSFLMERLCNESRENQVFDLVFGSKLWQELDAGLITRAEANRQIMEQAREQGLAFETQAILDDWPQMLHTRRRTVELMKQLKKQGYALYYLSNIPWDILELLKARDFWPLFSDGLASCEVRINKPDPRIYQEFLRRTGLSSEEIVFVDDRKENVQAAFEQGIAGIHYKGYNSFVKALGACGIHLKEPLAARPRRE